jgi:hypothetical protein
MNKELVFLRTFAFASAFGLVLITSFAFKNAGNKRFGEIDVERINIVEKDGSVKMIITNVDRFPNGDAIINGRPTNFHREKMSGMLFFNKDGMECGGFIYDGKKQEDGHSSGLSLTFDQYDGDQVMQLLTQDYKKGEQRYVTSSLVFSDRPATENQLEMLVAAKEIQELGKTDPNAMRQKYKEYIDKGVFGGAPRVMLGKSKSEKNGLFLYDDQGKPKAMFYVNKDNLAKLDFFNDKGEVIASFPENK